MSPVLRPRRRRVCDCLGITTCTDATHTARHRRGSYDSWDADGRPMSPALRPRRRHVCDLHELSCLARDSRHPLSGELVAALVCDGHDGDPGSSCQLMFLSCSFISLEVHSRGHTILHVASSLALQQPANRFSTWFSVLAAQTPKLWSRPRLPRGTGMRIPKPRALRRLTRRTSSPRRCLTVSPLARLRARLRALQTAGATAIATASVPTPVLRRSWR